MDLTKIKGLDHIGIPSRDIEKTIEFFSGVGFKVVMRTINENSGEKVAFLSLGSTMIETYQPKTVKGESGAIDHIALSVDDVDSLFYNAKKEGYMTTDLEELPFWENGVRFFKVTGPEGEVVELIQKL